MERIEQMLEKEEEETTRRKATPRTKRSEKNQFEKIMTSSIGTTIVRELTRGILGVFGISTSTRRSSARTKSRAKSKI